MVKATITGTFMDSQNKTGASPGQLHYHDRKYGLQLDFFNLDILAVEFFRFIICKCSSCVMFMLLIGYCYDDRYYIFFLFDIFSVINAVVFLLLLCVF